MKTQAKNKKGRLHCEQHGQEQTTHHTYYYKSSLLSSLKFQLGELLLYLQRPMGQNQRSSLQRSFEIMLRRYLDLKHSTSQWPYQSPHDGCNGRFNGAESTKCINKGNE